MLASVHPQFLCSSVLFSFLCQFSSKAFLSFFCLWTSGEDGSGAFDDAVVHVFVIRGMSSSSHISSSYTFLARAFPFRRSYRSSRPTQPPLVSPQTSNFSRPPLIRRFLHFRCTYVAELLSFSFGCFLVAICRAVFIHILLSSFVNDGCSRGLSRCPCPVALLSSSSCVSCPFVAFVVFFFCLLSMISRRMRVLAYIPFVSCRFPSDSCVPQALISPGWGIVSYFSLRFIDL